jgi:hypothetical protein
MSDKSAEKTPEEHLDYLESGNKLMLWWAWKRVRDNSELKLTDVIMNETDFHRRTLNPFSHYDDPDESVAEIRKDLLIKIEKLYQLTAQEETSEAFESACNELLLPAYEERLERDMKNLTSGDYCKGNQCGNLRHEGKAMPDEPKRMFFHIANVRYPGSLFDDAKDLPENFAQLMDYAEKELGVSEIATCTWLNSHPRWLELFPKSWHDHMSEAFGLGNHLGTWGQFLTARQTFNHKLAGKMRQSGKLPFDMKSSWCTIEEMRGSLEKYLAMLG